MEPARDYSFFRLPKVKILPELLLKVNIAFDILFVIFQNGLVALVKQGGRHDKIGGGAV